MFCLYERSEEYETREENEGTKRWACVKCGGGVVVQKHENISLSVNEIKYNLFFVSSLFSIIIFPPSLLSFISYVCVCVNETNRILKISCMFFNSFICGLNSNPSIL